MPRRGGRAPAVLVIAGSDPSGGAGLQGDLCTCAILGAYGMAVPTALTVQGPGGVRAVRPIAPELVARSVAVVLAELPVDAVKIGMLHSPAIAAAVMRALAPFGGPVVVDPVLRPTRGRSLASTGLVDALHRLVLPRATVLTPNLDEARALCGPGCFDLEWTLACAQALRRAGAASVLVKGGHRRGAPIDVLVDRLGAALIGAPRRAGARAHGTGCALATAIAVGLGRGRSVRRACAEARAALDAMLASDHPVGRGTRSVPHHGARAQRQDAIATRSWLTVL